MGSAQLRENVDNGGGREFLGVQRIVVRNLIGSKNLSEYRLSYRRKTYPKFDDRNG